MAVGGVLAEQPIGADHGRLSLERARAFERLFGSVIDDEQMVANLVERILVAARQHGPRVGDCGAVPVEHVVAQPLGPLDVLLGAREANLERAEASQRGR